MSNDNGSLFLDLEGKHYEIEFDPQDSYVVDDLRVAFCDHLGEDFAPVLFDPRDYGSAPFPPDFIAYRLVVDLVGQRLCILYEVYWRRQDCSWRELNKDHDHDYEQIQIHFSLKTGEKKKVVVSSVGPVENAGHGVEVYSSVPKAKVKTVVYATSPKKSFPWGGDFGKTNATQVREIPIGNLFSEDGKPAVLILNCYHAFTGLKRSLLPEERKELRPTLRRLDRKLLDLWYYRHVKNRFGHDVSKPFEEPYVMYYPPPEDWLSRFVYGYLWVVNSFKRVLGW